ncbi:unnamed protein product [Rotaria socialis]|uniref:Uncharacterized protein n=2 Tax=Rotaria socialis TaxID=392032 RepID=A0A817K575_9BILA|nr:unnamed protein product [Rotaria socialis]CAF3242210.1 unnamed protein product [Rotaria socialis]CAF3313882.1 unnamed protein product [Rotaria socialis]CAF3369387.1 unnamed protein product [Rotaria socialis]CAF3434700.1 unnamed protein product [Rotaria socialis]
MVLMTFLKRMNNTCIILFLFFALASCILSSYLDIPPPPERPSRFKTKEQIANYLKAVKDYYDAFRVKLVRRESELDDLYTTLEKSLQENSDEDINEQLYLLKKLATNFKQNQPPRNLFRQRQTNNLLQ